MEHLSIKNFSHPDEDRNLPKTTIKILNFKEIDITVMQATMEPGWKWSECVKPTVDTDSCETPHIVYIISGSMTILMDDGTQKTLHKSDVGFIPSGHDAWVEGSEPCVFIDFSAGKFYGMSPEEYQ